MLNLIKGFKKTTINQDPIATFNNLMGQLDANFRSIEEGVNSIFTILGVITSLRIGRAVLAGGTTTVLDSKITNKSKIFLTAQANDGTTGHLGIASRIEGVSFTILSSSGADTSVLAYLIIEPKE